MGKWLLTLTTILTMTACGPASHTAYGGNGGGTDNGKQGEIANPEPGDGRITFAEVNTQIFTPKCASCHSGFDTYKGVSGRLQSIRQAVETDRMPLRAPPLSDKLKTLLADWIDQGAIEQAAERAR
jgi:hypothetical protein